MANRFWKFRNFLYFPDKWVTMCMRVGLSQEEQLVVGFGIFNELERCVPDIVVYGFHPLG